MTKPLSTAVLLFDGFETLDAMGPIEMLGRNPDHFDLVMVAERAGSVSSSQKMRVSVDATTSDARRYDVLVVPGGQGTRREVENEPLLTWIRDQVGSASYTASICTGSALLARAGVLDGRRATTNKRAFDWVVSQGPDTDWVRKARWVEDGTIFTSSGVSAGTDMALALISRVADDETARQTALESEYIWNDDPTDDPFAKP